MARSRSKSKAVCQNGECAYYRKQAGKDVIKKGINRAGNRQYICLHCKTYFVETKGTPMYNRKISERKVRAICKELVQKKGLRKTAKATNVNKNTISKLLHDLAKHALQMTNYLVHDLSLTTYEVDELWAVVKKKLKGLSTAEKSSLDKARQLLRHA